MKKTEGVSIRAFAQLMGTTHPTISGMMKAYRAETGIELGTRHGRGKAILLSIADQEVLRERLRNQASTMAGNSTEATQQIYMPQPIRGIVPMPKGVIVKSGVRQRIKQRSCSLSSR